MASWAGGGTARRLPSPQEMSTAPAMPQGYAFDNPQLLTQQLLWGVIHGVRLLGITCQARGDTSAALAYVDWMERQQARIHAAERDLARHYFGRDTASPEAISAALRLKPALTSPPETLGAACATLPEALQQERYDLEKFYASRRQAIEKGDPDFPGAVWHEPADMAVVTTAPAPSGAAESPVSAPADPPSIDPAPVAKDPE